MKIDRTDKRFDKATPKEEMWLFNGEVFSKEVCTPKGYDIVSRWQEVTEAFKEQWEAEHQPEAEL